MGLQLCFRTRNIPSQVSLHLEERIIQEDKATNFGVRDRVMEGVGGEGLGEVWREENKFM